MEIEIWGRVFNIFKDINCWKKKNKLIIEIESV